MATFKVSTKTDKDASAKVTSLTIDFTGATPEILQEIATGAIVVKWQAGARKNGIPESATIKAIDYRPGTRIAPQVSVEALVEKMTDEERKALIAKLMGEGPKKD